MDAAAEATAAVGALLARYARRADDHDYDAWADLFCADAVFSFADEECRGRDAIRQWLAERLGPVTGFHSIVNLDVTVEDAERLRATADFAFSSRQGDAWVLTLVGRYEDVVVREGGEWRLSEHRIRPR